MYSHEGVGPKSPSALHESYRQAQSYEGITTVVSSRMQKHAIPRRQCPDFLWLLRVWFFFFLVPLPECSPNHGEVLVIVVPLTTGQPTVIYSQSFGQLGVSTVTTDHCKKQRLWPELRAAPVYEHKHSYVEGSFTGPSCPQQNSSSNSHARVRDLRLR